jgi:hypothetical protein
MRIGVVRGRFAFPARICLFITTVLFSAFADAATIPKNLANGLYEIVKEKLTAGVNARSLVLRPSIDLASRDRMLWDQTGRIKVDIRLNGLRSFSEMSTAMKADPEIQVTAETADYQAGIIEAM